MRKILFILAVLCFLMCGCQKNENSDASEYQDELSKAQEITVVSEEICKCSGSGTLETGRTAG